MNKTSKKWIILLAVYLIVLALLLLLPGYVLNLLLVNAIAGADMGKYVQAAPYFCDLDQQTDPAERNKAFLLRDVLSDSLMDQGIMSMEYAYEFYHPAKQLACPNGCYVRVCRPNEDGEEVNLSENFALVDLEKLSGTEAGETLYEYCKEGAEPRIKVERYALDGFECYPLSISIYHHDTLLKTVAANQDLDVSGMEVAEANDVFMNPALLCDKLSYIRSGKQEARERLEPMKKSCDYSVEQVVSKKIVTPFTATLTTASTKDGYGFFVVTRLHTEKLLKTFRIFGFIGWTVFMGFVTGISLIVMLAGRKK